MDSTSRLRVREWIVPADLDRTHPLDQRDDFLGRSVRLLRSVYHIRLKATIGELLYTVCDSDRECFCFSLHRILTNFIELASILSSLVGYGNVAGFLFNKGIMSAPPPPSTDPRSARRVVNPITGTYDTGPQDIVEEMTEEEKEMEMDKLFVLFDRLERSGAPPPNQRKVAQPRTKPQHTSN